MTIEAVISKMLQNKLLAGARIRCRVPKIIPSTKPTGKSMKWPPKPNGVTHAQAKPSSRILLAMVRGKGEEGVGQDEQTKTRNQALNLGSWDITSSRRSMPSSMDMILCTTCR